MNYASKSNVVGIGALCIFTTHVVVLWYFFSNADIIKVAHDIAVSYFCISLSCIAMEHHVVYRMFMYLA